MKYVTIPILFIALSVNSIAQHAEKVLPAIEEVFLPFNNIRDFTLSNTGEEAYFSGQSPVGEVSVIFKLVKANGKWKEPVVPGFSGNDHDLEPFLSPDNLRLYFVSNRPNVDRTSERPDYDIWYVERKNVGDEWSVPINVGPPVNTENNEFYPSVANSRNIYFTSDRQGTMGKDDVFISRWVDSAYAIPIVLDSAINTDGYEFNAFVSPDESFLIFSGYNRPDGMGSGDLYISKNKNGAWGKAVNMGGNVNSRWMDYCPFVLGDTLYFTSKRSLTFTSGQAISNLDDFNKIVNSYENGLSRIYKIHIGTYFRE